MRVFIVHAQPEPKSFNGALTRAAMEALTAAGHEVALSDLREPPGEHADDWGNS